MSLSALIIETHIILPILYSKPRGKVIIFISLKILHEIFSSNYYSLNLRLKGVVEPQRVLKPGDLSFEQNRQWRPQIGMVPSTKKAFVTDAGKIK